MTRFTQLFGSTPPELVLWDVVTEHLDEAAFHFEQWERGIASPVFVLNQISNGFEDRLEQHIAGLIAAGPAAVERLLYPELEEMTSPARTTLAALLLLRLSERNMLYELLDFLSSSHDDEQRLAIKKAIALNEDPRFEMVLREAYSRARSPREKAILLEVFSTLHLNPGEMLSDCFGTSFTALDVAATRAAGQSGRRDLSSRIEENLRAEDQALRQASIEAGLLLGLSRAWFDCRRLVSTPKEVTPWAMLRVALLGSFDDHQLIYGHLDNDDTRMTALWAMGFTGNIKSAELCLQYLESNNKRTAKLAGEAFSFITGLCRMTIELFLAEPEPEPEEDDDEVDEEDLPTLEDDNLDADIVPDSVDELPLLDPFDVASWYERKRDSFSYCKRYLAGADYTPMEIVKVLATFPMRRRHELALELTLRTGARRHISTSAFTKRQLRELQALSDLEEKDFTNRFDNG